MPTKAYILIETAVGKSRGVANELRSLSGVETVDRVAVTAAATAHLHADSAVAVIVGPADQIAPGLGVLNLGDAERVEIK